MSGNGANNGGVPPNDVNEGGSLVTPNRGPALTTLQKFGIGLLVLVVLLAFVFLQGVNKAKKDNQPEVAYNPGTNMHAAPMAPPPTPKPASMPMPPPAPAFPVFQAPARHEMTPAESPIFAFGGSSSSGAIATPAAAAALAPDSGSMGPAHQAPDNSLTARLKPTVLTGAKASLLPHPDMLVTKGTVMACILDTAIDSQLAGFVRCHLPADVLSTTGNVVLLDKGTIVTGEVQNGLAQGQNRLFILWDRAETPDHAVIELASPAADELGRSGVPGRVNNHWWARFGDAILLSVIQGGLNAGTALAANSGSGNSNGGATAFYGSFQSNSNQVSNTALQNEINIPPTLEKNQGDAVSIFVAKDLDFSDVYDLRVTGASYGQ